MHCSTIHYATLHRIALHCIRRYVHTCKHDIWYTYIHRIALHCIALNYIHITVQFSKNMMIYGDTRWGFWWMYLQYRYLWAFMDHQEISWGTLLALLLSIVWALMSCGVMEWWSYGLSYLYGVFLDIDGSLQVSADISWYLSMFMLPTGTFIYG